MNFADYFNRMQEHYANERFDLAETLVKDAGSKLVTYEELEVALSTIAQNTSLAVEQTFQAQEAKLGYVLKVLNEQGVISEGVEEVILDEFNNINALIMEDEINE